MSLLLRISFFYSMTALSLAASDSLAESSFQTGNKAYENADYEAAKTRFKAALEIDESPATRHNLGLTYLQLNQPAQAIWQLERALLLNPSNLDYREKRNLIREQLGLAELKKKWYFRVSQLVPVQIWWISASISFWVLLAALILPCLLEKKSANHNRLLTLSGSLCMLIFSLTAIRLNFEDYRTGILIHQETIPLNAAPATVAPESGFARPGEHARILDQYNHFYQIKTEGSATGWVSKDHFRPLVDR